MSEFLTTWKEIAAYLGKGVRTVQRWEEELGLPVRRPVPSDRNAIFALRSEIDEWMKVRTGVKPANQLTLFRERIESLEAENRDLRAQVASLSCDLGSSDKGARTIIVVDDNPIHAYALRRMLEGEGYSVSEAHTGSEAIRMALVNRPDLVLLDINLPDVDGFDVCQTLLESGTDVPAIVFHTATSGNDLSYSRGMSAGAAAFLSYPVAPEKLFSVVAGAIATDCSPQPDSLARTLGRNEQS